MRTDEERIKMMHARAAELIRQKRTRKVKAMQAAGAGVSFAVVIMLAILMSRFAGFGAGSLADPDGPTGGMHASIFGNSAVLGYIVIAIIAFLLGAAVIVFCFRLKQWQDQKGKEDQ